MTTDIYAILNEDGDIRYIGQSVSGHGRQRQHWNDRERRNNKLHLWLRTLPEPPRFRILAIVEDEEASPVERACIRAMRKATKGALLNERTKGALGAESRARLSAARMGRQVPAETRAKIGAANAGRPVSDEIRAARSARAKAMWADPERRAKRIAAFADPEARARRSAAQAGKTKSPETRAKLSAAKAAQWNDPEYRRKTSNAHIGRKASSETRAKQSAIAKANWARRKASS